MTVIGCAVAARKPSPSRIADEIRSLLRNGGSPKHAAGVQWFFKDEIKSHGWYTADLRKSAVQLRRTLRKQFNLEFLVRVSDRLFVGEVLEEKIFAVFLLETVTREFDDTEFKLFET